MVTPNGTLHIADGTYNENNIQINSNMTITGENQQNTIIDAQKKDNIFDITLGVEINLTPVNLTLTNGKSYIGGAIDNEDIYGILNIKNVTFNNNTATYGGAIYNQYGTLTETNNTFNNNTATIGNGGAIYNSGTGTEINNTFNNNTAIWGGGAICNGGTLIGTNDTFNNNTAGFGGGAIYNGGTVTETNNTFNNNTAGNDGGAIINMGTLTVTDSKLLNNTS